MPLVQFIMILDSNNYQFFHLGISTVADTGLLSRKEMRNMSLQETNSALRCSWTSSVDLGA